MPRNEYRTIILSLLLVSCLAFEAMSQRQIRRTRREAPPEKEFAQDWLGISLGTIGFGRGFSISGKFAYAFEFEERFSIGANGKFFFDNINRVGVPDDNFFTYGAAAFTRIKITEEIFAQGEYSYTVFNDDLFTDNSRLYPSIGGGYKSGFGDWTYGFHVLLPLDEQVRDRFNLEYWIDFNYKF